MLTVETLGVQLRELGWPAVKQDERTFRCVHAHREGEIPLFVRLDGEWVIASVVPFLRTRGQISFELSRWLLRVNRDMYQAKFAYDDEGDVVLAVELPIESLDPGELRGALTDLVENAVLHRRTLRAASA